MDRNTVYNEIDAAVNTLTEQLEGESWKHMSADKFTILGAELGAAAKSIFENDADMLFKRLTMAAALIVKWMESDFTAEGEVTEDEPVESAPESE